MQWYIVVVYHSQFWHIVFLHSLGDALSHHQWSIYCTFSTSKSVSQNRLKGVYLCVCVILHWLDSAGLSEYHCTNVSVTNHSSSPAAPELKKGQRQNKLSLIIRNLQHDPLLKQPRKVLQSWFRDFLTSVSS